MIKHIVMWKLKDECREENAKKIKELIENLNGVIKEIKNIEVGININKSDAAMDVVLYSEFNNLEDLDIYQNHPEHVKAGSFVKSVAIERKVCDFEV